MNLNVVEGPNFSGRTRYLREWVGLPPDLGGETHETANAYVGPDAASAFSGFASTVAAEIDLMAADRDAARKAREAVEDLGFGYCLPCNPFVLSGGEQAVAAIIAAVSRRPRRLAIDCAFEQLSDHTRSRMLAYLVGTDGDLLVADNRLTEWYSGPTQKFEAASDAPAMHRGAAPSHPAREAFEIEVVDLCHYYIKGRPVLTNLNLTIESGKHYVLSGPNGSGKSTLSKILCGLVKPTSGEIRLNGMPVLPWRRPGEIVGYHFQNPDYQMFATTVESQLDGADDRHAWSQYFGLDSFLRQHPLDLPFTLRKRVALAAAFARGTPATILDEPTLAQDDASGRAAAVRSGTTISISHSRLLVNRHLIRLDGKGAIHADTNSN